MGGVEVYFHVFLTAAIDGGEWSTSWPGHFTFGPDTNGIGVWARPGLNSVKKRIKSREQNNSSEADSASTGQKIPDLLSNMKYFFRCSGDVLILKYSLERSIDSFQATSPSNPAPAGLQFAGPVPTQVPPKERRNSPFPRPIIKNQRSEILVTINNKKFRDTVTGTVIL
jgi:hypothetical protein